MDSPYRSHKVAARQRRVSLVFVAVLSAAASSLLAAQQAEGDNTGTNPINFTYDWRTYTEMQSLPGGDNSLSTVTIEQRMPLSQKVQFRFRVRHSSLSLDPDEDGISTETSGLGDWDARLAYIAKATQRYAIALGIEAVVPAATNTRLGSGKYTLGPQIFGVLFRPPGGHLEHELYLIGHVGVRAIDHFF